MFLLVLYSFIINIVGSPAFPFFSTLLYFQWRLMDLWGEPSLKHLVLITHINSRASYIQLYCINQVIITALAKFWSSESHVYLKVRTHRGLKYSLTSVYWLHAAAAAFSTHRCRLETCGLSIRPRGGGEVRYCVRWQGQVFWKQQVSRCNLAHSSTESAAAAAPIVKWCAMKLHQRFATFSLKQHLRRWFTSSSWPQVDTFCFTSGWC